MRLSKGHGTENDFLLLYDPDGSVTLTPSAVAALCDRRAGLGADGVLRAVRSANDPDAAAMAPEAEWFMDYRNADGSHAEMCGNGMRVFLRYLQGAGVVEHSAAVATRGGVRRVQACGSGDVSVQMGQPRIRADRPIATAALTTGALTTGRDVSGAGTPVDLPNPHLVVPVDAAVLADLDLTAPPRVEPVEAERNVEFIVRTGPRRLSMRVHERGSGETRSCGTGICAAVVATAVADGVERDDSTWTVDVPGGSCTVRWQPDDEVVLTGPAVLLAEIDVDDDWLARHS